jgi:hypothetical protein
MGRRTTKGAGFAGGGLLGLETVERAGEEGERPGFFVGVGGVELGLIAGGEFALGVERGPIDELRAAAAFLGEGALEVLAEKMFQRADEVAAESAFGGIGAVEEIAVEEVGEKPWVRSSASAGAWPRRRR